jgi:hypothetical protein
VLKGIPHTSSRDEAWNRYLNFKSHIKPQHGEIYKYFLRRIIKKIKIVQGQNGELLGYY